MISFENVSFSYKPGKPVLLDVNTHIYPGEFVCILGNNGSGKSTFAKLINALLFPTKGRILVNGIDAKQKGNRFAVRSIISMVFQNPDNQLVASIVEDEVAFGPENLGIEPYEIKSRVFHALEYVQLDEFGHREIASLSGGQKQRVAIAGALAMNPKVLVLDEASSMLDPQGQKALLRICRKLNDDGVTIIMVTHSMEEALWGNRCLVLSEGKQVFDGTPDELIVKKEKLGLTIDDPFSVRLSRALNDRGVGVPLCASDDQLVDQIVSISRQIQ